MFLRFLRKWKKLRKIYFLWVKRTGWYYCDIEMVGLNTELWWVHFMGKIDGIGCNNFESRSVTKSKSVFNHFRQSIQFIWKSITWNCIKKVIHSRVIFITSFELFERILWEKIIIQSFYCECHRDDKTYR